MSEIKRARLKTEEEVIGEGVPMLTADQHPLSVGDLVYSVHVNTSRYDDEDELGAEFTAHRCIQLNYQYRYARFRCANGCEETLSYDEGCSTRKLYHSLDAAKKHAREKIEGSIKDIQQKIEKHKKRQDFFKNWIKNVRTVNTKTLEIPKHIPMPKKKTTEAQQKRA